MHNAHVHVNHFVYFRNIMDWAWATSYIFKKYIVKPELHMYMYEWLKDVLTEVKMNKTNFVFFGPNLKVTWQFDKSMTKVNSSS